MSKFEKVMKGLECCSHGLSSCDTCPYYQNPEGSCMTMGLVPDAIEVLKAQGNARKALPVAHYASPYTGVPIDHCPTCGKLIKRYTKIYTDEIRFCAYCGQEVIWDE